MYHKPLAYGIRVHEIREMARKNDELTVKQAKAIIVLILRETHKRVVKDVSKWIKIRVPKMTGRLRRDLLTHLLTSYVTAAVLRIFIQTSIDYAKRVNDFETFNVRHKGKKIKYRGKTIRLNDRKAIGHFFDEMIKFTIKTILYHLDKSKRKYASRTKMKYNEMRIIKLW